MGRRARGANAVMALAFAPQYGAIPASGFFKMPFVSANLGDEQGLVESDLLGMGREPLQPADDVVNNEGDATVPVDLRYFGLWLKMHFGAPTTTPGIAATGTITFADQPASNATITINGQAITFVAGTPAANQVKIGTTLKETLRNAVWHLNASAVAGVAAATYTLDRTGTVIAVAHKTLGTAGNAFTLVAGSTPDSHATVSGATLTGGAATGAYTHVFTSGAQDLPDAAIEIGNPEVPAYSVNYGAMLDRMVIPMQRSGNLNATLSLIAKGETPKVSASIAGALTEWSIDRFSQFSGEILLRGVPVGEVVSGNLSIGNGLEKAENIRPDGRIDGADAGMLSVQPTIVARFADLTLYGMADNKEVLDLAFGWTIPGKGRLTFRIPSTRLPKAKNAITGPGGIQATYAGQAFKDAGLGKTVIVTLTNDVAAY